MSARAKNQAVQAATKERIGSMAGPSGASGPEENRWLMSARAKNQAVQAATKERIGSMAGPSGASGPEENR